MLIEEGATADPEVLETTEVIEQPEKSMDDTIRDTLRELTDKGATLDTTDAIEEPEEKAARIRDEKGKFKAKTEEVIAPVAEIAPEVTASPAPNTWTKAAQEKWAALPPEVHAEVAKREADFHKGIEQYKQKAQFADTMQTTIAPYMATIQGFGVTPDVAVKELLSSDHILRYGNANDKAAMVMRIFKDYSIDPRSVFDQIQNGPPQVDPNISNLQKQVQELTSYIQNQTKTVQEQENQALNSEIETFANDPSHSHFMSVKGHMSALLQAGHANDLKDAYEQAVWANPTTRAAMIAEQQRTAREEATQKAQAAKQAASVNVPRRPSMPVSQPIGSMDDTIRDTLRRLQGS